MMNTVKPFALRKWLKTAVLGLGLLLLPLQNGSAFATDVQSSDLNKQNFGNKTVSASTTKSFYELSDFTNGAKQGLIGSSTGLTLDSSALLSGTDTTGKYNSGSYYYGTYTTDAIPANFTEAIASWQANTAPGTWTEVELSAQVNGAWTKWYSMGVWLQQDTPFKRHSVNGQGDTAGTVYTDTLSLAKGTSATAVKARISLFTTDMAQTPSLRSMAITFSNGFDTAGTVPSTGLTSNLDVPKRSQMVFANGGEVWCSPTSTSMVMAYWSNITGNTALNQTVPTVVNGVWDYVYNGGGNWPFNSAYAASMGLNAKVVRLSSLSEIEQWTHAGVPVITSIAFKKGALDGAPIASTSGHLVVVRGFDANGNVLVNDPAAASDAGVALTYDRLQYEHAWLDKSNGTCYIYYPTGWTIPASNGHW